MFRWAATGWRTFDDEPVGNRDILEAISRVVLFLRAIGVEVQFWEIPRERNQVANNFANEAMEGMQELQCQHPSYEYTYDDTSDFTHDDIYDY